MPEFFNEGDDMEFWENMGVEPEAQESEAVPEEGTPAEVVAEETPAAKVDTVEEGRPRDDKGRFVKAEGEAESEAEAEVSIPDDDSAALREQIALLEKRIADKDEFSGRLSNELGELRQQLTGIEQHVSRPQAPSSWDELIEDNPAAATMQAYELARRGDQSAAYVLEKAAAEWEVVAPGAARIWADGIRLRNEMEQRLAQLEKRTQPVVQQNADQARAKAYLNVKTKYPDIEDHIDKMREVSPSFPVLVEAIESGTPEEAEQGWELLYRAVKAGQADTLRQTAQQVARNAVEGEQRVREEAVVASAAAVPGDAPKKSASDLIGEEWDEMEKPYLDGWQIS